MPFSPESHRTLLLEKFHKVCEEHDKHQIALAAGSLGVSITFAKQIIDNPSSPVHPYLLYISWTLWGISLIASLAAFQFVRLSYERAIDQLDVDPDGEERLGGIWDGLTRASNWTSSLTLIVGIITFIIFASLNIGGKRGNQSETESKDKSQTVIPFTINPEARHQNARPSSSETETTKAETDLI